MLDWLVKLVVAALAVWRISVAVWYENGPLDVYNSIRERIREYGTPEMRADKDDKPYFHYHNVLFGYIWSQLECFWCVTFWVSLPVTIIIVLPGYHWLALIPFALSGVATLLGGAGRTIWRETAE